MKSQSNSEDDEFFIGWEQKVPPVQRQFLYHRLIGIFAFVFSLAILLPYLQRQHEPSFYNYMKEQEFEGVFIQDPLPSLLIPRPGTIGEELLPKSHYLVVGKRKYGLDPDLTKNLDQKWVRFKGTLIYNRNETLIEVDDKTLEVVGTQQDESIEIPKIEKLGRFKLSGEIASSKSYYGMHNPGFGKPQRASAVRSIAGGIPPVLIVRDEEGIQMEVFVTGNEHSPIGGLILDYVGVPVRVFGELYQWGDKYLIETVPDRIELL